MLDLYAQLGVDPDATEAELRVAWREAAFTLHPDRNPGDDGRRFRAAAEAWALLSDRAQRARYDQLRYAGSPNLPAQPSPSPWEAEVWARVRREQEAAEARRRWVEQEARREAMRREAARQQYEIDQMNLEAGFYDLGDWTRAGTLRNGGIGRRR